MKAARLHGPGDLRVADEDEPPPPGPGESLVEVSSVGICGSDLHWFTEGGIGDAQLRAPLVPGHEFAGTAITGPYAGRRVAVDPAIPCEQCEQCRRGYRNLCPTVRFAGHGELDGALRERMVWPDGQLFPIPDEVSDDAGALLEPLGVAIHALDLAHVRLGADVLVVGGGPIGILIARLAGLSGAGRVFVSEPLAHRREAAAVHADAVWEPADLADALADSTGGRGADTVLEIAGTDPAIDAAVDAARPGARIVLGGIPSDDRSSFVASTARRKGLTFAMARRMNETYPRAIALARTKKVDLDALVTARYGLEDAAAAFGSAAARTGLKTVITGLLRRGGQRG
jgi:L-iditol 2-dehydrogenase